jgi:hypothetical protein
VVVVFVAVVVIFSLVVLGHVVEAQCLQEIDSQPTRPPHVMHEVAVRYIFHQRKQRVHKRQATC